MLFVSYLRLMRIQNVLMVSGGYLLMHYGGGRVLGLDTWAAMPFFHTFLIALALGMAAAWGYVINDIKDLETDRVSHPRRPLPSERIEPGQARVFGYILLVFTLALTFVFSWLSSFWWVSVAMILVLLLEYVYTEFLRSVPIAGVLATGVLVSTTVFLPLAIWYMALDLGEATVSDLGAMMLVYGGFAFLMTTAREQVKDLEDMEGDVRSGYVSLPVVIGREWALQLLRINLFLLIVLAISVFLILLDSSADFILVYGLLTVLLPLTAIFALTWINGRSRTISHISIGMKVIMAFGLLSVLFL